MRFKRYYTAFRRYNRSRGFGIHSPFAFHFVTSVLGERSPFYAYDIIDALRHEAATAARAMHRRHPRMISVKNARMLHRVACACCPDAMMQIGVHYGVSTAAVMEYDSRLKGVVYSPSNPYQEVFARVTTGYAARLDVTQSLADAMAKFRALTPSRPMLMINHVDKSDTDSVAELASDCVKAGGIIVMRHLGSEASRTSGLWHRLLEGMQHGMSFTNGNIGFIVAYPYLPKQHFPLWF